MFITVESLLFVLFSNFIKILFLFLIESKNI